jgi:hypothetical protein
VIGTALGNGSDLVVILWICDGEREVGVELAEDEPGSGIPGVALIDDGGIGSVEAFDNSFVGFTVCCRRK